MPIGIGEAKGTAYVETSHSGYLRVKSGSAAPERPIVRRIFWQVAASCLLATAGLIPISALADDDSIANQLGAYLQLPRICLLIQPTISHCLAIIRFNFLLEVATLNDGIRKIITGQSP
jgi:hypothetical protein